MNKRHRKNAIQFVFRFYLFPILDYLITVQWTNETFALDRNANEYFNAIPNSPIPIQSILHSYDYYLFAFLHQICTLHATSNVCSETNLQVLMFKCGFLLLPVSDIQSDTMFGEMKPMMGEKCQCGFHVMFEWNVII